MHTVNYNHQMVHFLLTGACPVSKSGSSFSSSSPGEVLMKVECITLREIRMQLKTPFETSFGVTQNRRILLVEAIADGVSGWGEVTAVEAPSYNSETTDTAWHIISDFIAPCVIGKDFVSAAQVPQLLDGIRGHHMAKAGVENAFWDVEAQHSGMPLSKLLGGTLTEIACGVSVGIQESPNVLVNKVERELRSGYQRIKLKIKPGKDVDFISAVRNRFPDIVLSVDANSAYRLADSDHLRTLDDFQLLMIEQPLEWDDINSHAKVQAQIRTAICLDECINHAGHARDHSDTGRPVRHVLLSARTRMARGIILARRAGNG